MRLDAHPVRSRAQADATESVGQSASFRKRHRAAALEDAGAHPNTHLRPRGHGVRQPYAALFHIVTQSDWQFQSHPADGLILFSHLPDDKISA